MLFAKDIMNKKIYTAEPHHSLNVIYAMMKKLSIRHIPITSENVVLGLISEKDLLLRAQFKNEKIEFPSMNVKEILKNHFITCSPYTSAGNIAATMIACKTRCILVIDNILKGIITTSDILDRFCFEEELSGHKVMPLKFAVYENSKITRTNIL